MLSGVEELRRARSDVIGKPRGLPENGEVADLSHTHRNWLAWLAQATRSELRQGATTRQTRNTVAVNPS